MFLLQVTFPVCIATFCDVCLSDTNDSTTTSSKKEDSFSFDSAFNSFRCVGFLKMDSSD